MQIVKKGMQVSQITSMELSCFKDIYTTWVIYVIYLTNFQ